MNAKIDTNWLAFRRKDRLFGNDPKAGSGAAVL